jgi:predicted glycosyltransferase
MFKNLIYKLENSGHAVKITINTKDILEDLIIESGIPYENILVKRRKKNTKLTALLTLLKKDILLFRKIANKKYDILIGTEFALTHVGFLLRKTVLTFTEDDADVIKDAARIALPFTTKIVAPNVCNLGKFENKKIGYDGYQKLAYLHPNFFTPNPEVLDQIDHKDFFLIRLSSLNAYHDRDIVGFNENDLIKIIKKLEPHGKVFISSEKELPKDLAKYNLKTSISQLHQVLYFAKMLICDSQSTAVESAILGTPSIRYNSFAGRISVLEELEHKYGLTFGIAPPAIDEVFNAIDKVLEVSDPAVWDRKRDAMLKDKIDVIDFWFDTITSIKKK